MNIVNYAAFAYALTTVIAFAVISIVVVLNWVLMKFSADETEGEAQ